MLWPAAVEHSALRPRGRRHRRRPDRQGGTVTAALACANRDPRAFTDPDRLDLRRPVGQPAHLGYAHGPHFCLGAALARVQTEVALTALLRRFPDLALAEGGAKRIADPGTYRLTELVVTLSPGRATDPVR